jgi:hypothetical protein
MRKLFIFFGFFLVLTAGANSAETGLSTDLMQSIEDTNKSLASNVAIKDAKAATSDAKELTEMFAQVETFFVQKGDAKDAVDLAKKSKDLTIAIVDSVAKNNFDAATDSATNLARTCRTCHTFYKKE